MIRHLTNVSISTLGTRLTLLVATGLLLAGAAARADIALDVSDGIDNTYRFGAWMPFVVRLTGEGRTASAQLEVVVRSPGEARTYAQPLNLHAGPLNEKHVVSYYHPGTPNAEVTAQLTIDGRVVASKKVENSLPINDSQPAVVSLTQDRSGLTFLNSADLNYPHRGGTAQNIMLYGSRRAMFPGTASGGSGVRVLRPAADELPASPSGYGIADLVFLGDLPVDSLTEDEWNALVQWVKDGGTLIVSGGADVNRLRAKQLAEILPIEPTGAQQVRDLPELAANYGTPVKLTTTAVTAGALKTDATAFCRQGPIILVALRPLGIGRVIFTAFDVNAPEFRVWSGQTKLWQEFMRLAVGDLRLFDAVRSAARGTVISNFGNGYGSRALQDALAGVQATDAPSFAFIGIFLLAYIVFLVPVNYLLLRSRDRKEMAWITAPAIILLFTTGAYAVGRSIKGGQLFLRYGAVVEGAAGSDDWQAYTVSAIFSPTQSRYDLSAPDRQANASEIVDAGYGYQGVPGDSQTQDLTLERTDRTTVKGALVNMWDHRTFDFQSHLVLGGSINASVVPDGTDLKVQVTNNTRYRLTECGIAQVGSSPVTIGTLNPGQSSAEMRVQLGSQYARGGIPLAGGANRTGTSADRIKQTISAMLAQNDTGVPGNNPIVFTAWCDTLVTGLTIAQERPRVEGATLLVAHLPVPGGRFAPPRMAPSAAPPNRFGGLGGGFGGMPPNMAPATPFFPPPGPGADAMTYNNYAYTLAGQGRLDEALQTAYQALHMSPQDGNILDTVAEMHQRKREYATAAHFYELALARQPNGGIAETHEKYGETLLALHKKTQAIPHLQRAAADAGVWGVKARQALRALGIQVRSAAPGGLLSPPLSSIPPPPATGSGTRRFARRDASGGSWVIVQRWSTGPNGTQSSTTSQYYPPGAKIPP